MKISKSLRGTIILFVSMAAILPIVVFGLVIANISSSILKDLIQNKNELLTKVLISRIEEYLIHPHQDLNNIRIFFEDNSLNSAEIDFYLHKIIRNHTLYARLQIADENGIVVHVAPFDEQFFNIDVSARPYFKKTRETERVYWSETFISSQFDEPVVSISMPLKKGVVTAYISLKNLTESIKELDIGENSFVAITDQTATYIAHFDFSKVQERVHDPFYDQFKNDYNGEIITRVVNDNGIEMICHVSFIEPTDWAVSIFQSKSEVLAPVQRQYKILMLGVLLVLILSILFSFRFSQSIKSAIRKITSYTGGVSAGNYDLKVEDLDYAEFTLLGRNVEKMALSIKNREERIRESERVFRAVFNSRAIGGSIIDENANFIRVNEKWLEITGYQADELMGMKYFELVDPGDKHRTSQLMHNLLASAGETYHFEIRLAKKDGKTIWIEQHASVVNELDRQPFVINLAVDITDRKRSELERSRLVSVIEQTNEHVLITGMDGSIEYVNPAFERITGYSRDEVTGQNPRILQSGHHDEGFYRQLWETITSGEVWTGRMSNRTKAGKMFDEHATIFPVLDREGAITNFAAVKRDITDQLKMEHQLRQSQKMEAIGTLAGGIAHDFNNIISALSGYARLARNKTGNPTKTRHYLDQIDKATHRAGELVGQILTFSRKSEHKKSPMLLHPIIKEALKFIRSSIPATIIIQHDIQVSGYVKADPTQVYQIIINLCTNAYHAMQDNGGTITVSLAEVVLEAVARFPGWDIEQGRYLKLTVRDTGQGFSQEIKNKLFEPYFTTKPKGGGTGLGLAMVHGIVSSYRGCIEVSSSPGEGSEFNVFLPVCDEEDVIQTTEEQSEPVKGGSEHVLVVDDEEQMVNIIEEVLTEYGYRITRFTDSRKAYEAFADHPHQFDLLITDLIMPSLTGIQLIERVRQLQPRLPTILFSGHTMTMDDKKASYKGINAYLEKPFSLEKLAITIRRILDEVMVKSTP